MKTKKNDFIELDFAASIKDGTAFDTTIREEAIKAKLIDEKDKREFKPLEICIGEGMVIKGFDKELEGKETGKEYSMELNPDSAFGKRDPKLMRAFPLSVFKERPFPGMLVNVEGAVAKVISAAGGRVTLDFNSPLAGKIIVYKFKINRIIEENEKKIKALANEFDILLEDVKIENKNATVKFAKANKAGKKTTEEFGKKVKEIIGLELQAEI
jgi:FKBP-type peptidyl-prolyl cis-trans isomerase SlyD